MSSAIKCPSRYLLGHWWEKRERGQAMRQPAQSLEHLTGEYPCWPPLGTLRWVPRPPLLEVHLLEKWDMGAFLSPRSLCSSVDTKQLPQQATTVLSSAHSRTALSLFAFTHEKLVLNISKLHSLFNLVFLYNNVLATALKERWNTLLIGFRFPHFSRQNYLSCLAHIYLYISWKLPNLFRFGKHIIYQKHPLGYILVPEVLTLFINS